MKKTFNLNDAILTVLLKFWRIAVKENDTLFCTLAAQEIRAYLTGKYSKEFNVNSLLRLHDHGLTPGEMKLFNLQMEEAPRIIPAFTIAIAA